jgi:hypothetical protein
MERKKEQEIATKYQYLCGLNQLSSALRVKKSIHSRYRSQDSQIRSEICHLDSNIKIKM